MYRFAAFSRLCRTLRGSLVARALLALAAVAVLASVAGGGIALGRGPGFVVALAAAAFAILLLVSLADDDRRVREAIRRNDPLAGTDDAGGETVARLCDTVERIGDALRTVEHRLLHRHPVSGLPTREPLLRAIDGGCGMVGILHFIDLERMHAFDEHGADALLATLTERLTTMLGRDRLIAQVDRARVAIWYGPETDEAAARAQLDALGYALGGPVSIEGREILPEVRVSAAAAGQDGVAASIVLARAIAGADQRAAYPDAAETDPVALARERFALEQDLRRAIDRGELELHYQPLVDAQARRVCGAEALLRWRHPVHGLVPPTRFVPIMEAAGLADEIGLWVINTACREAQALAQDGLAPFRIAVNVSRGQLDRQDLPALVERTLARHSLSPEALEIELTETVATADTDHAAALFERIRALGVAIAIDDFGTGYSSLSALRTLHFDKIKIDREFVTAVERRRDSQAICRSIMALGQGLGIRVLAEGVETAAEYRWLRTLGCAHFQGYYFARPLTAEALRVFARDAAGLQSLLFPQEQPSAYERLSA